MLPPVFQPMEAPEPFSIVLVFTVHGRITRLGARGFALIVAGEMTGLAVNLRLITELSSVIL